MRILFAVLSFGLMYGSMSMLAGCASSDTDASATPTAAPDTDTDAAT